MELLIAPSNTMLKLLVIFFGDETVCPNQHI